MTYEALRVEVSTRRMSSLVPSPMCAIVQDRGGEAGMMRRVCRMLSMAFALGVAVSGAAPARPADGDSSPPDRAAKAAEQVALERGSAGAELSPESRELQENQALERKVLATGSQVGHSSVSARALTLNNFDVPMVYEDHVSELAAFFQGAARGFYAKALARSTRYLPLFREILRHYGAPEDLVYLSMVESGFMANAYSKAHAAGPWQFIPESAHAWDLRVSFWVDERRDFVKSTHAAARYLNHLHGRWNDWYLAWAAYNGSPERIGRMVKERGTTDFWVLAGGEDLPEETRRYVPKILAAALIAKNAAAFGFGQVRTAGAIDYDVVRIPSQTELAVIAQAANVTVEAVRELNPEILRMVTPPVAGEKPYALRLPKGARKRFESSFRAPNPGGRYRAYRVQVGDTLRKIAASFRVDGQEIIRLNELEDRHIFIGMELVIPPAAASSSAVRAP